MNLANNRISKLPSEFQELKSVEELNIGGNRFKDFPEEILSLVNLKSLYISRNRFKNFPIDKIKINLPNLKTLYCYGPRMEDETDISKAFLELSKVKGNSIREFHNLKVFEENLNKEFLVNKKFENKKSKIFISYSHKDLHWLERTKTHLKALEHEGVSIDVWDDTRIKSGQKWKDEIELALRDSYIGILIISADFLASDFIVKNEMPPLLENSAKHGTKIIPLIASPCRFIKNKNLSEFQTINDPKIEILSDISISKQESIFVRLTNVVDDYIKEKQITD